MKNKFYRKNPEVFAIQWTGKDEEKELIKSLENCSWSDIIYGKDGNLYKEGEKGTAFIWMKMNDWFVKEDEETCIYKDEEFKKIFTEEIGSISDGYHTFDELYYHRMRLFSVICNQNWKKAWKSKLHSDGTMFENYFIVGVKTVDGEATYHYHMEHWDDFDVKEIERAPEWDGHTSDDVLERLKDL